MPLDFSKVLKPPSPNIPNNTVIKLSISKLGSSGILAPDQPAIKRIIG
jgi:hypothetical protein